MFKGIFCPNSEKRKSQAKSAEKPDAMTSIICVNFSFRKENIPMIIPEIIRIENKSVIVSPDKIYVENIYYMKKTTCFPYFFYHMLIYYL